MGEILELLRAQNYKFDNCQIIRYDRHRPDLFKEGFLSELYWQTKASGRRSKLGVLRNSFCGMRDLSHDSVTAYLANRHPLLILAVWKNGTWEPAGYAYLTALKGEKQLKFAFGAFVTFLPWWGRRESSILVCLATGWFFREFQLQVIVGERYASNDRAARFMRQFGFRDVGTLSKYLERGDLLVPGTVSECLPGEFESAAEKLLIQWSDEVASEGEGNGQVKGDSGEPVQLEHQPGSVGRVAGGRDGTDLDRPDRESRRPTTL